MAGLKRRGWTGRDGFTLLETLVALSVGGLVMLGAAGLADLLRTVETRASRTEATIERVSAAKRLFRSVVAQAEVRARSLSA